MNNQSTYALHVHACPPLVDVFAGELAGAAEGRYTRDTEGS